MNFNSYSVSKLNTSDDKGNFKVLCHKVSTCLFFCLEDLHV